MILVGTVERLDEHFYRSTHLKTELVSDFLLMRGTFGQHGFERLIVGDVKEALRRVTDSGMPAESLALPTTDGRTTRQSRSSLHVVHRPASSVRHSSRDPAAPRWHGAVPSCACRRRLPMLPWDRFFEGLPGG